MKSSMRRCNALFVAGLRSLILALILVLFLAQIGAHGKEFSAWKFLGTKAASAHVVPKSKQVRASAYPFASSVQMSLSRPSSALLTAANSANPAGEAATRPIALVFRGPATDCCWQAMARMLQNDTKQHFKIVYVGGAGDPNVETGLAMPNVKLYAQPGGDGTDYETAYRQGFQGDPGAKAAIQNFVKKGGRYLGICMGAYFTASDALDLFPGQLEDYTTTSGASVTDEDLNVVIPVIWRGHTRHMFYQDGPDMVPNAGAHVTVLATFSNGKDAAVVAPYGSGKVGISGPHPEASPDWYTDYSLSNSDHTQDLGNDLIDTLMQ
jgi:glutamine amidotransferase-like uncharacterized protein